ncbi:MAG: transcriptional regulator GcvA [Halofilum sp. (in: g-proteobacteria)]|nr:transcriptional regulator GcvA [Halofilum sp. (in: g-proteobacteria)]
MSRQLPPLNALRAFEAAGRHLSFSRAAEELHVTPAAVSHQIKSLEQYLGVRLFRRRPHGLLLTEAGQSALPGVSAGFDRLARAVAGVRDAEASRPLTVSVAPSFASKWLVPRLEDFRHRYAGTEVRIDATERMADFRQDDVDLAVRYGSGNYEGLHVERLAAQSVFPVCSPWLAQGDPPLREPDDLRHHTLIHVDWARAGLSAPDWPTWLASAGVTGVDATAGPRYGQQSMAVQAAIAGHGVALGSALLVADDLAAGRLVRPFEHALHEEHTYFLVCLPEAAETPRVKMFRDWLFEELADTPAAQ